MSPALQADSLLLSHQGSPSWPLKSIEIDKKLNKKFRQGFIGPPVAAVGEQEQITGSFAP